ncbi:hypothetical protein [Hyphomicrobium sp. 802]|uniref:hypothetical protein n=1 Tax=Hyphomicrobium sp. 802 TaxID=1112272 RepID=UPI00045E8FBD|nr:hypothetical protein [Hyphomicrobium sp. 802]
MLSIVGFSSTHTTALQLLKKAKGEDDGASDKTDGAGGISDPFADLFAPKLDENDGSDDGTYKPSASPLTTASGSVVEPLTDEGGFTDAMGNPLPVAYTIKWHGVEVARIYNSGGSIVASGFDLSSLDWDRGDLPPDEKDAAGNDLTGMDLANKRFEKLTTFFATQA